MTASQFSPGALVHARYRVVGTLGVGGVATVYRAIDEQLGRDVALKVIPHGAAGSAELRRIEDEVRLLASLNHPALVTLYDVESGDSDAATTLIMQFIDGEDLSARIARGALAPSAVAEIGLTVSAALAFVHDSRIIHRDVKPANILLPSSVSQQALLADFGIARLIDSAGLTATGTIMGTASYLSPEQARGGALTDRTDIYSLGLVLLEALTGTRAFPGSVVESVAARLASDPKIPTDLGTGWVELIGRMVDSDPARRPSAAEVNSELARINSPVATLVMPAVVAVTERLAPAAPTAATERLMPAAAEPLIASAPVASTTRVSSTPPVAAARSRRGLAVVAVLAAILVAVAIVFTVTRPNDEPSAAPSVPAETPATTQTPVSSEPAELPIINYPVVEGALGERLSALQGAVAAVADETLAHDLGLEVLAVSDAAAAGLFEESRGSLEALTESVDAAELSAGDREAITEASRKVREELDALIKDAEKPGNGKPDKKP